MNTPTTTPHILRSNDEEQQRLHDEIQRMGAMAAAQIDAAIDVIHRRDDKAADRVIANDDAIDELEQQISNDVMRLALRGPLAGDLRVILAALRIASDIERVGDYAANLAKRSKSLNQMPPMQHTRGLDALARVAAQLVRDALRAYDTLDVELAEQVRQRDVELDQLHTSLFRELLTYMMEDPRSITSCTHLLFMAKNLERIGDHATNIAENIIFRARGDEPLPPREKRDDTSSTGLG